MTRELRLAADPTALAELALEQLARLVHRSVKRSGRCWLALSGGSTPERLYRLAAARPELLPWEHVELWWGDERCVPHKHADSNYRMARELLLEPLGLQGERVHPVPTAAGSPQAIAAAYEAELLSAAAGIEPRIDVALMGLGEDGHTASLFPGSRALAERERLVVAVDDSPKPPRQRVSLGLGLFERAGCLLFLVSGYGKAEMLAEVLQGEPSLAERPASALRDGGDEALWLIDQAAASRLG